MCTWRSRIINRGALKRLTVLIGLLLIVLGVGYRLCIYMPGRSFAGPLPPLTPA